MNRFVIAEDYKIRGIISFNQYIISNKLITVFGESHEKINEIFGTNKFIDYVNMIFSSYEDKSKIFVELVEGDTDIKDSENLKDISEINKKIIYHDVEIFNSRKVSTNMTLFVNHRPISLGIFKFGIMEELKKVDINKAFEIINEFLYEDVFRNFLIKLKNELLEEQKELSLFQKEIKDVNLDFGILFLENKYKKITDYTVNFWIKLRDLALLILLLKKGSNRSIVLCGNSHAEDLKRILHEYLIYSKDATFLTNGSYFVNIKKSFV